ncbi:SRPBCC family protein [Streptosporangium sp. G11]|uniref:SRPBCC family protein n=1 Tax=Streptosporangium sp. G11 TaxID=3436926 RepID=UPI003EBC5DC9
MAMRFEHEFTVPLPVEQAWPVLLDVERIAPCLPGAAVDKVEGDSFTGRMKMKIGPITVTYQGRVAFEKVDEDTHSMTLNASGKEARGPGVAGATVVARLHPQGRDTRVTVDTSFNVTGRPAQFGRGVMTEVGGKLVDRFAANLSRLLGEGPGVETAAETTTGTTGVGGWSAPQKREPVPTEAADDVPAISETWGPGPARPAGSDSPTGSDELVDSTTATAATTGSAGATASGAEGPGGTGSGGSKGSGPAGRDATGSDTTPPGPAGSTASGTEAPGTAGSAFPGPAGSTGHGAEGPGGTGAGTTAPGGGAGTTAPGVTDTGTTAPGVTDPVAAASGLGGPGGPEGLNGPQLPGGPGRHLSAVPTPPDLAAGEEAESRQSHPAGTSRTSLSPDEEALNLLEVAGLPLLKRVAPLVAALAGIILLAWLIRRALRR